MSASVQEVTVDTCGGRFASYKNQLPVVVKGALDQWDILQNWRDPKYLAAAIDGGVHHGATSVDVYISRDNRRFLNAHGMVDVVRMTPAAVVDYVFTYPHSCQELHTLIVGGKTTDSTTLAPGREGVSVEEPCRVYLRTKSMPEPLYRGIATPEKIDSFVRMFVEPVHVTDAHLASHMTNQREEFVRKVFRRSHMQLWLGTTGNVTPLHFDRNHGLLAQVMGSKCVDLFSHADTPYLYRDKVVSHTSRIDLREFDSLKSSAEALKRFPMFEEATRYTTVLSPGDLLYTPPFWWHEVTSLDNSLSVTFPWDIAGNEEIPPIMLL